MVYTAEYASSVGMLTIASDGENVTGLWMEHQRYFPNILNACNGSDLPVMRQTIHWLDCYFSKCRQLPIAPPLALHGTAFQICVWEALLTIPYGQTRTYGEIGSYISHGTTCCARAVGNAVGRNPISILIPCHRVVPARGGTGFYAGGADKKAYLLALET